MFNSDGISLSDIAAVTGNDGIGGGNGWWVLIILFALFGGWGNGNYNRGGCTPTNSDIQGRFDTQTIVSKLDGISNGICSLGYDQLSQMNNINSNITTANFNTLSAIQQNNVANMQGFNNLQAQNAASDAAIQAQFAQVRYDQASNKCDVTNLINQAVQQIMQNDNANYRALHDENVAAQLAAKDAEIASLRDQNGWLRLNESQCAQNEYLLNNGFRRNTCGCNTQSCC